MVGKNSKERTYNVYACKSAMYCLRCPISRWMPGNPGEARGEFVVWHSSYELVKLRSVLESSWCGKTDLVLLVYFISVSIVKKDGDDIIKTC